ncbi:MAG: phenylalanine--tRNA ligase subunit beta [Planctomycetota bacterium]
MIVSEKWLADYVDLSMPQEELTDRLTISGLNLEGLEEVGGDTAIDLEVTSNRPDCLGHVGVAREVAVLFGSELKKPDPQPKATGAAIDSLASVELKSPELCPRYTARLIRGVKVGPSPEWLAERLRTLGIAVINNVVDITNYVMMECAQPLHAFDYAKLAGGRIVVRESRPGEKFTAINHQEYELAAGTCVIADAERAVALAGVMGGADTEVSDATVDVLIEAADFEALSVRRTARRLNLHSPSSYRFERGVDPEGIDWASRRCCELILELAGGELAEGVLDEGSEPAGRDPIKLRFPEIERVLGISVPKKKVRKILTDLGCEETHECDHSVKAVPPSWRADLTREIDLVEEVARIHGYDQIPEDAGVRMVTSSRSQEDRVLDEVRGVMVAGGFCEAMTISTVEPEWVGVFRGWSSADPLATSTSVLRRANCLRQSLLPSLLAARRTNETLSNRAIELFEVAKVYLPEASGLPAEKRMLGVTSGGGLLELKGLVEALVARLAPAEPLSFEPHEDPLFAPGRGAKVLLGGELVGYLGQVASGALDTFELRGETSVAEIDLGPLVERARLTRTADRLSPYPPVTRDLNVVFDESAAWSDVERIVVAEGGELIESVDFQEEWRDAEKLGAGKKSLLFSVQLRSIEGTLTGERCDGVRDAIVSALGKQLGGELRA